MRKLFVLLLACCLLAGIARSAETEEVFRPMVTALRVPDGMIVVDGYYTEDWMRLYQDIDLSRIDSRTRALILPCDDEFSAWSGASDSSVSAMLANDSKYLYVFASVYDQMLINNADMQTPFNGDDFEVFIDASPAETRFTSAANPDYKQLIFLPANINLNYQKPVIWQEKDRPGIQVASTLQSWGYTIELAIPKALFPNWVANPNLDAIGFDIAVNDSDTPGIDCHHPSVKLSRLGLSLGRHFQNGKHLGMAVIEQQHFIHDGVIFPPRKRPNAEAICKECREGGRSEDIAFDVLASLDDPKAGEIAKCAAASMDINVQKAGYYLLYIRPAVPAPVDTIVKNLKAYDKNPKGQLYLTAYAYALMALGERKQLPVDVVKTYLQQEIYIPLKLSAIWALGQNKNADGIPLLAAVLEKDTNSRARMAAAMALGELGDAAAIPALQKAAEQDKGLYVRQQAKMAIDKIQPPAK